LFQTFHPAVGASSGLGLFGALVLGRWSSLLLQLFLGGVGGHFVDFADGMGHVSGRSRMRLVRLAELGRIITDLSVLLRVTSLFGGRSLGVLFVKDFPDGNASSFSGASPVRELFESPCAHIGVPIRVFDLLEGVENLVLDALLVREDVPAVSDFLIRVFGKMKDGSDHDYFVEADRLLDISVFEGSDHDGLIEGDRLSPPPLGTSGVDGRERR